MNQVKFAAVVVAIASLVSLGRVQSQTTNEPPPMGNHHHGHGMSNEERMDKLSEELNLTPEQRTNVQAVFEDMRQKIMAAIEEARTNADAQLQGILSPEQYQKLQSLWQQHQQHFEHHWGSNGTNSNSNTNETNGQ